MKDPAIMIAGSNLNSYYLSSDTGKTWTQHLTSSLVSGGDPVIECRYCGCFLFFHLSNPPGGNWIDHRLSEDRDNGATGMTAVLQDLMAPRHRTNNGVLSMHTTTISFSPGPSSISTDLNPADSSSYSFPVLSDQGDLE